MTVRISNHNYQIIGQSTNEFLKENLDRLQQLKNTPTNINLRGMIKAELENRAAAGTDKPQTIEDFLGY